jgi:hypothetical protein
MSDMGQLGATGVAGGAAPYGGVNGAAWAPTGDIKHHNGREAVLPNRVFFRAPPPEIGEVQTAHSDLAVGKRPMSSGKRINITFVAAAVCGGIVLYLFHLGDGRLETPAYVVAAIVAAFAALIAWFVCGFAAVVTYVGTDGIAKFRATGEVEDDASITTRDVIRFADVNGLRTSQTRNFYNGVYTGTSYSYTFTDAAGKRLYHLTGTFKSKEGNPKADSSYWFAWSSEIAWSQHLLNRKIGELEKVGYATFPVRGNDAVRVGPGWLEFVFKGETTRITPDEIASLNLNGGYFHITSKDARWFSSKGKFNFAYGQMDNARVFLLMLEKLVGYSFG